MREINGTVDSDSYVHLLVTDGEGVLQPQKSELKFKKTTASM